jgi:hypothetical protein
MKFLSFTISSLLLSLIQGSVWAKVAPEQVQKLGSELTFMGAEMSANDNGRIPKYTGGLKADSNANPMVDIYAQEKPLYVITHENMSQYQNHLTNGQIALFKKYPSTYKMPVYPTHRSASYPQGIYDKAIKNAQHAELVDGGNGMINFDETVPFAIPQNGLEVIWNHVSRFRGGSVERNLALLPVQANGKFNPVKVRAQLTSPQYLVEEFDAQKDDNILFYYTSSIKSPARLTGNVLLVHETIDQVNQPRKAWAYNAGQRRVRRSPQVAYDAPSQASDGLRTSDQIDIFNGAPNKYHWKLVGKKEIYIAYNAYKLADQSLEYSDMIQPGHLNQDFTRYELHRVWQVEATLKDGERHIYGKRTYYVDEDSWQIASADHYDRHDILWRVSEGHALQFVNANALWYIATSNYDLLSGRYLVELNNEEHQPFNFGNKMKRKQFTAGALRRSGR